MKYAVGIDVGGTNTRVALINEEYKILERVQFSTDSKDPEIFILSGSVALKIPRFIEEVEKRTKEKVYDALKENVKIVSAALGEDCGLIGAACLILHDPS